jgi:hypothetical protein
LLPVDAALTGTPIGRLKWKVAPQSALLVAQSFPRCAAMMVRQTERPSPIPLAFVVKKGSKICSIFSSGMLLPRSVTDKTTSLLPFSIPVRMSSRRSGVLQSVIASQELTTKLTKTC